MAANSKTATFGKRVVKQIWTASASTSSAAPPPPAISFSLFRRSAHASVYDKNIDEHIRPAVVPDEVIKPDSDKYWAPHPQTGVFGPATDQNSAAAAAADCGLSVAPANGGQGSLLEKKAWFRPTSLEDMEKPHHV